MFVLVLSFRSHLFFLYIVSTIFEFGFGFDLLQRELNERALCNSALGDDMLHRSSYNNLVEDELLEFKLLLLLLFGFDDLGDHQNDDLDDFSNKRVHQRSRQFKFLRDELYDGHDGELYFDYDKLISDCCSDRNTAEFQLQRKTRAHCFRAQRRRDQHGRADPRSQLMTVGLKI